MCSLFQLALEKYEEMFPAFTDSRECKLLKVSRARIKIITTCEKRCWVTRVWTRPFIPTLHSTSDSLCVGFERGLCE